MQKVNKYSGYFWKKICSQELPKIAQSGHTTSPICLARARSQQTVFRILKNRQKIANQIEDGGSEMIEKIISAAYIAKYFN